MNDRCEAPSCAGMVGSAVAFAKRSRAHDKTPIGEISGRSGFDEEDGDGAGGIFGCAASWPPRFTATEC